jgi:Ca2+/H+ antiporter
MSLALGSALASIGLSIPVVVAVCPLPGIPLAWTRTTELLLLDGHPGSP